MPELALPPTWIDAGEGASPEYTGAALRAMTGALLTASTPTQISRSGALDLRALKTTLTGQAVTVAAGAYALGTGAGAYICALSSPLSLGNLAPADATNPRRDVVVLRVDDPANGGSTARTGSVELMTGVPSATPSTPAVSGASVHAVLAHIDVPRVGAGNPVLSEKRTYTAAAGGTVPVQTRAELDAWAATSGTIAYCLAENSMYMRRANAWKRLIEDASTGWTAVSVLNPFKQQGSYSPSVKVLPDGETVLARWGISSTGLSPNTEVRVMKLPAGFVPGQGSYFPAVSSSPSRAGRWQINNAGDVLLFTGAELGGFYLMDGLTWSKS